MLLCKGGYAVHRMMTLTFLKHQPYSYLQNDSMENGQFTVLTPPPS